MGEVLESRGQVNEKNEVEGDCITMSLPYFSSYQYISVLLLYVLLNPIITRNVLMSAHEFLEVT